MRSISLSGIVRVSRILQTFQIRNHFLFSSQKFWVKDFNPKKSKAFPLKFKVSDLLLRSRVWIASLSRSLGVSETRWQRLPLYLFYIIILLYVFFDFWTLPVLSDIVNIIYVKCGESTAVDSWIRQILIQILDDRYDLIIIYVLCHHYLFFFIQLFRSSSLETVAKKLEIFGADYFPIWSDAINEFIRLNAVTVLLFRG